MHMCNSYVYGTVKRFAGKNTNQQWLSGRREGWGGSLEGYKERILLFGLSRRNTISLLLQKEHFICCAENE